MPTRNNLLFFGVVLLILVLASGGLFAQELDVSFDQVEYSYIYQVLGEAQGLNVVVDPGVVGKGTFQLKHVTFTEALDLISTVSGYKYRLSNGTLLVAPAQVLETLQSKEIRYVQVHTLSSEEIAEALVLVMPRSDVYVHPQGGLVVLQGSKANLDQAEELLLALDRSQNPGGVQMDSNASTLLDIFKDLSSAMGLNLVADPTLESTRLHLDVRNQDPEEIIKQIQMLVPVRVEITGTTMAVGNLARSSAERVKVYRLNYAEPEAARSALAMLIAPEKIQLDEERKSLIVRGTDAELAEVDLFLVDYDQSAPQVVLEVWVQEISSDALQELGVEWRGLPSFMGGDAPVFFELQWEPWELILALRIMEEQGDAKLLANPQITTLSGQEASIFVGDRVPVVLDSPDGTRTMEFLESGINLKVTPRISDDEYVTILVQPEVSTFIWRTDTAFPQIRTREAETTVRVKNGQPFVLGGLLQDQENELIKRIPFLSQLPLLGQLFQWKESTKTQTEMTIFVIPRIVEEGEGVVHQDFFTQAQ